MQPMYSCKCCHSFLYKDQLKLMNKRTHIMEQAKVAVKDQVCCFCYNKLLKNDLPICSSYGNDLFPEKIPDCLL